MTIKYTLEARRCNLIHAAHSMLKHRELINISLSALAEAIGKKLDWEIEDEDVVYDPESPYMDTIVRDAVMDAVAEHFLGRPWPCNGDRVDMHQFLEELDAAIKNKT